MLLRSYCKTVRHRQKKRELRRCTHGQGPHRRNGSAKNDSAVYTNLDASRPGDFPKSVVHSKVVASGARHSMLCAASRQISRVLKQPVRWYGLDASGARNFRMQK